METTLVLIKPGAIRRGEVGEILKMITDAKLTIEAGACVDPPEDVWHQHYAPHFGKAFYDRLISNLKGHCVYALWISGGNAVQDMYQLQGPWQRAERILKPDTIRGRLMGPMDADDDNRTHSSETRAEAEREKRIWLPLIKEVINAL